MGEEGLLLKHNPFMSSSSWWRLRPLAAEVERPNLRSNPFLQASLESSGFTVGSFGALEISRMAAMRNLAPPPARKVFLESMLEEDTRLEKSGMTRSPLGRRVPLGTTPDPVGQRRHALSPGPGTPLTPMPVEQANASVRGAFLTAVDRLRMSYPELSSEEAVKTVLTASQVRDPHERELTLQELLG